MPLCISRKPGERVQIGPDIWVTVMKVDSLHGKQPRVRLLIDAPASVKIWREELLPAHRGETDAIPQT